MTKNVLEHLKERFTSFRIYDLANHWQKVTKHHMTKCNKYIFTHFLCHGLDASQNQFFKRTTVDFDRVECSPMVWETGVQSLVESYQRLKKWYLMSPCLTLSIVRFGSRVKWSNPGKGVVPFPTPWCWSYWKGSLRFTLDYGHQLY